MFAEPLLSTCVFLQLDMPFMPLGCVNVDSARRGAKDMTGVGKHTPAQPNISLFSPSEYPNQANPSHAMPCRARPAAEGPFRPRPRAKRHQPRHRPIDIIIHTTFDACPAR